MQALFIPKIDSRKVQQRDLCERCDSGDEIREFITKMKGNYDVVLDKKMDFDNLERVAKCYCPEKVKELYKNFTKWENDRSEAYRQIDDTIKQEQTECVNEMKSVSRTKSTHSNARSNGEFSTRQSYAHESGKFDDTRWVGNDTEAYGIRRN
eukprot:TRINITY_DN14561_c0_g1_i1.p1 TRINITY_DN14561_c0_g1~~TRINITY_DN14561_c0_g1_i1.p1  ORF type:complete len:162 (-),score=22.30 TRINITY_DN14561_c0_g1_i1:117-572(-)